jgi:hypothetical protein
MLAEDVETQHSPVTNSRRPSIDTIQGSSGYQENMLSIRLEERPRGAIDSRNALQRCPSF